MSYKLLFLFLVVGLCAGCNTEKESISAKPDQDSLKLVLPDFSSIQTSDVFVYNCGDSLQFSAHVTPDSSWLFLPDTTVKVKSVRSGSGARYEGNAYLYWSKGNEAILQKPKGSFMTCQTVKKEKTRAAARIRGVDFLALGQEPGWRIEIKREQITYIGNYGQDTVYVPVPQPTVDKEKNRKTFTTQTEAHTLTVEITDKLCTDSMSGFEYPSTVKLTIDGKTYQGCGEAL